MENLRGGHLRTFSMTKTYVILHTVCIRNIHDTVHGNPFCRFCVNTEQKDLQSVRQSDQPITNTRFTEVTRKNNLLKLIK